MTLRRSALPLAMILLSLLLLAACVMPVAPVSESTTPPVAATTGTDGCVEDYDPAVDYFPAKITVDYASFEVEYFNNYKVVTIHDPWLGADQSFTYVLVQCGTPAPEDYADAPVIEVPIRSIVSLSTTYLPQLEQLGLLDKLVAVDSGDWTTTEAVRAAVEAGDVAVVGSGTTINVEQLLDLDPGLIMAYSIGMPEYDTFPVVEEAGLPVALNGDFVENDPLGRTEWIKYMALFFNAEETAQTLFGEIESEYNAVAALAAAAADRPTVFLSSVYDGTWWMAGSQSYMAQLLADAGADYLWADSGSVGSSPVDFEAVLERAADADYWINPDNTFWFSIDDVLASDERYVEFAALTNGHLYNNNAIVNENGGSAFYESGAANPHIVLKDLVKILHPDLLPEHKLVYYVQVQ
ncbi:MAG: ABC transporter substrate-binding protein [Caldilineaceae bacterium]